MLRQETNGYFLYDTTFLTLYFYGYVVSPDEYVICLGCKSPDTILSKENRLFFLRCEQVINGSYTH